MHSNISFENPGSAFTEKVQLVIDDGRGTVSVVLEQKNI